MKYRTAQYQASLRSLVSHELKIPLTGLFSSIHFLKATSLSKEQKEQVNLLQSSIDRLLQAQKLIDTLLQKNSFANRSNGSDGQ